MNRRICVVGAGHWGSNHVRTLASLGCLGGLVDTDEKKLSVFREQYPKIHTFARLEQAFEEQFDGFTVATPAATHFQVASAIIQQKKPVLVEKPLALSTSEALQLKNLAESNAVNLMVGHVLLFHPAIRKLKELIVSGKIGKLQYLYSNRLNLGTVRSEENILWSFAPHDISIFQHFIGVKPLEVVSRGGAFVQPHIHDSTLTLLGYPNNIVGHIFVSWLHPFKEHRLVVIGNRGMLSFEDSSQEKHLLFYEKGVDVIQGEPVKRDGVTEVIPYDNASPLSEELAYFVSHLESKEPLVNDAASGIEVLEILEQASECLQKRETSSVVERSAAEVAQDYLVHPSSYVDEGATIGAGTKIWHYSHIQSNARIGMKCSIGQNVNIGNNVIVGNFVKIQNNVSVYEGVQLEDYVFCGPSMVFTNVLDPRAKYPQRGSEHYHRTLVREGASIGANATIVCGNTIGRHAFIGAGAVVTHDVPDYALMVGVPARQIGWVCECGEQLLAASDEMRCSRCSLVYQVQGQNLLPLPREPMILEKETIRSQSLVVAEEFIQKHTRESSR